MDECAYLFEVAMAAYFRAYMAVSCLLLAIRTIQEEF